MFEEIISSLKRNKLRTALTGFAVSWGIFILIVLLGAGNGLIHSFEQSSNRKALNSMRITPGWTSIEYKGLKSGRAIKMSEADIHEITTELNANIIDMLPVARKGGVNVSYDTEYISAALSGVYPSHPKVEVVKIEKGRFINQIDMEEKRKVCVISRASIDILFPDENVDPMGKIVNCSGVNYKIVGIYEADNSRMSQEVYVPFTTLMTIYDKGGYVDNITLTTKGLTTIETNDEFEDKVRTIMGERRMFNKDDTGAMWIYNRMSNYMRTQKAMTALTTAIWVVGILTLISGIVGVSNIMLITVKERTHEFGIRKALGARPYQILALIVTESIAITSLFGYVGMMLGIGATELLNLIVEQAQSEAFSDPTVDISICIEATLTLVISGTLAGFFPAKRAVSIKPIEALRG